MAEIIGAELMEFAIVGEYSGTIYGIGIGLAEAERYIYSNGFGDGREARELAALEKGEAWKSHEDARGVKITRTA